MKYECWFIVLLERFEIKFSNFENECLTSSVFSIVKLSKLIKPEIVLFSILWLEYNDSASTAIIPSIYEKLLSFIWFRNEFSKDGKSFKSTIEYELSEKNFWVCKWIVDSAGMGRLFCNSL